MEAVPGMASDHQDRVPVRRGRRRWLCGVYHHRRHTTLGGQPPITRVNNPAGRYIQWVVSVSTGLVGSHCEQGGAGRSFASLVPTARGR